MKLRTFDKRSAPTKIKVKNKDVAIRSDLETFARLLVIQKNRNISVRKSAKIELFKHSKSSIELIEEIPENTPSIHDGMLVFQNLPPTLVLFGDIPDYILQKIMKAPSRVSFFITDYYQKTQ